MPFTLLKPDGIDLSQTFAFTGSVTGAGGISQYQQWRLTSALNSNASDVDITSNLEVVDTNAPQTLGSGMSESSGIFTFPSTGVYLVTYQGQAYQPTGEDDRGVKFKIKTTTNNAQYTISAQMYQVMLWTPNNNQPYTSATISCVFDVTDTSTHKVKFAWGSSQGSNIYLRGNTDETNTNFQFLRLGDT